MKQCPSCSTPIDSSAVVDSFNDPKDWLFWGSAGTRWIVCQGDGYVHFRCLIRDKTHHRLAVIREQAQAWIETERAAADANKSKGKPGDLPVRLQDDWL